MYMTSYPQAVAFISTSDELKLPSSGPEHTLEIFQEAKINVPKKNSQSLFFFFLLPLHCLSKLKAMHINFG